MNKRTSFDEAFLKRKLTSISLQRQVMFAVSCASRLFPTYATVAILTGHGNPTILQSALEYAWALSAGAPLESAVCEDHQSLVMHLIDKDHDDSGRLLPSCAEDAASAVAFALRTCLHDDPAQEAMWAARRVYECIDMFVGESRKIDTSRPGAEIDILSDPLIQTELSRQWRDIEELISSPILDQRSLARHFRERSLKEVALPLDSDATYD